MIKAETGVKNVLKAIEALKVNTILSTYNEGLIDWEALHKLADSLKNSGIVKDEEFKKNLLI